MGDVGDAHLAGPDMAVAGPGPTSIANKRAANVTTTVVGQDGTDSARVGACSNCRSRKIKCSGDRPICRTCAKNGQQCDYPLHVSRKRKDRESSSSKRQIDGGGKHDGDLRRSVSASQGHNLLGGSRSAAIADQAVPQNAPPVGDFLPPYDFGIDPLHFQTQMDPAGVHIDNAWLESFLSYDFGGGENPFGLPNTTGAGGNPISSNAAMPSFHVPQAPVQAASTSSSGMGEGGPSSKSKAKFRVPFFRFFGPTAIAPGYRQVIADVSAPPSPNHRSLGFSNLTSISPMDAAGDYPSVEAVKHLLPLFHLHFSYFFPLLPPPVESYTDSPAHLINIICALAARYSPTYAGSTRSNGLALEESDNAAHTWASKAKEQVSQHLAISDDSMVQTLLMISWYEFGQDRDSGLWMYSGMSLRMGQDLGLDTVCADPAMSPMPDHSVRHRLAGSLLMQDAIMTIGTGRSGMYPTPSSATSIPHFPPLETTGMIDPFHYLIKIFAIAYRVTQVLVQPDVINAGELLERAQSDLNEFNTSLPAALRFETSTFRNYAANSQGGAFVLIHLWFHTLIILAYQPTIIYSDLPSLDSEDLSPASKEISASSAKTILDIVVFAELIDLKAITQPWINYPMYTAGRTFLSQTLPTGTPIDNPADPAHSGKIHMAKIARTNFQKVVDVLGNLQTYWAGVRYIRSVLIQKGEGVAQLSLVGEEKEDVTVPDRLSEWIANASNKQNSDIMGLSFSGTMHSPTDSRLSVVYPSKGATGH